ncbi:MAG TPA: hypothetical protein VMR75_00995 [Candidatus Saccharimonadales bacterium]|nr:hypothetical protein [Candidatus Saccharimonadales bacterium]
MSAMRALKDRAGKPAERLALVLCGALATALLIGFHVEAKTGSPVKAVAASASCQSDFQGVPCKGPIQSLYAYAGEGSGDTTYIKAKAGKQKVVGERLETNPLPRNYRVTQRTFTWHSRSNIEIVAVYVIHRPLRGHPTYQKLSTGRHSGHATLTFVGGGTPPLLLLQGRHGH